MRGDDLLPAVVALMALCAAAVVLELARLVADGFRELRARRDLRRRR